MNEGGCWVLGLVGIGLVGIGLSVVSGRCVSWPGGGVRSCPICRASLGGFRRSSSRWKGGVGSRVGFGGRDWRLAFFLRIVGGGLPSDRSGGILVCGRTRMRRNRWLPGCAGRFGR